MSRFRRLLQIASNPRAHTVLLGLGMLVLHAGHASAQQKRPSAPQARAAAPQGRPAVRVGQTVRIVAAAPYGRVTGRVIELDRNSLRVVQPPSTTGYVVPYNQVQTIHVRARRSRSSGALVGALRGAAAGALVGVAAGAVSDGDNGALIGGGIAVGAAVGGAYGFGRPSRSWIRVPFR